MEHESTEPKSAPPTPVGPAAAAEGSPQRRGIDRRSLLRAGAGAAPVLLTLHSGPVSATGTMACTVASSFVSAATFASRSPGSTYIKCSTKNAGTWRDTAINSCGGSMATWPAWAKVVVKTHLACNTGSTYETDYVGNILKRDAALATSGELAILQHTLGLTLTMDYASSYITTAGAPGGELTKTYLANVWSKYKATGKFTDTANNIDWDATGILSWLKMLQYDIPVA